jgi:hypothetical protein
MKNAMFWDVTLCGSCMNWYFGKRAASIISAFFKVKAVKTSNLFQSTQPFPSHSNFAYNSVKTMARSHNLNTIYETGNLTLFMSLY